MRFGKPTLGHPVVKHHSGLLFPLHSGLFLNVEKTEILNLKEYNPNTQFLIESFGASHTIKLVK